MVEIVKADKSHLDDVAALFDSYRVFYQQDSNLSQAREFLQQRLTGEDSIIFVAYQDGKAVGFTQLYPSYSSVQMKRSWILNDLFVAEFSRQQGVAELLMSRVEQHAIDTQAVAITLQTAVDNTKAQALYHKLDYQRVTNFYQYRLGT